MTPAERAERVTLLMQGAREYLGAVERNLSALGPIDRMLRARLVALRAVAKALVEIATML